MEIDELFLGPNHKILKTTKFDDETNENHVKCKVEEVNKLLSLRKVILGQPRYEKKEALSVAQWDEELKLAKVTKIAKNLTKNFAHAHNKAVYLYPEECLCLMEMKCLELTWKERILSIKNAYTLLLNHNDICTFEQFRTYSYLVKLGFRVFRHDRSLINTNNFDPKDLTKLPVNLKKKKFSNNKQMKNIQHSKKKVNFPKLNSGEIILLKPPQSLTPNNIQLNCDTYSFNITVTPLATNITEFNSFRQSLSLKNNNFFFNDSTWHTVNPTVGYPVYEKNIVKFNKSKDPNFEDLMYVPPIKKPKCEQTEKLDFPVAFNTTNIAKSIDMPKNLDSLKCKENLKLKNTLVTVSSSMTKPTLNDSTNVFSTNNKTHVSNLDLNHKNNKQNRNVKEINVSDECIIPNSTTTVIGKCLASNSKTDVLSNSLSRNHPINNLLQTNNEEYIKKHKKNNEEEFPCTSPSCSKEIYVTNKLENHTLPNITSGDVLQMGLNIPSCVTEKLFAIKSKHSHAETISNNNDYYAHYDVYYPDNNVPKKSRTVPDFRVIVFKDGVVETFPNIYNVTVSSPNDNVPMLWAIVNSSQVSFYNVDNIVLPKSTAWEKKNTEKCED